MKLTFKVEKTTSTDIQALINKSFFYLKELDYCITNNTNNIITFQFNDSFKLVPRGQNMNRLDSGIIEFNTLKQKNIIKLTYSISITFQIIIIPALLIVGLFESPVMFVGIVTLLVFIISFFITKRKAEGIINEILNRTKDDGVRVKY